MHEQGTHGAKCVRHSTNDQNMINMHNNGNPQKIGTHRSPKQQENANWTFYQTIRVHTLHIYVKQCMNIRKSILKYKLFLPQGANIQSK